MDAEKHLWIFLQGDNQAVKSAVETVHVRNEAAQTLGRLATQDIALEPAGQLQAAFDVFINNPQIRIPGEAQLDFMKETWVDLGYAVPDLSRPQADALDGAAILHPDRRVVPAPLLELTGRHDVPEKARIFPASQFDPDSPALRLPLERENPIYRELLADMDGVVEKDGELYVLLYKTPHSGLVRRGHYIAVMEQAGQAIADEEDEHEEALRWTFSMMNVQVQAPRLQGTAEQLYAKVSPVSTPESLEITAIMQQAAGTPNPNGDIDFANEAVFQLDTSGVVSTLQNICTVRWRTDRRSIGIYARRWNSERNDENTMGVRAALSGI